MHNTCIPVVSAADSCSFLFVRDRGRIHDPSHQTPVLCGVDATIRYRRRHPNKFSPDQAYEIEGKDGGEEREGEKREGTGRSGCGLCVWSRMEDRGTVRRYFYMHSHLGGMEPDQLFGRCVTHGYSVCGAVLLALVRSAGYEDLGHVSRVRRRDATRWETDRRQAFTGGTEGHRCKSTRMLKVNPHGITSSFAFVQGSPHSIPVPYPTCHNEALT